MGKILSFLFILLLSACGEDKSSPLPELLAPETIFAQSASEDIDVNSIDGIWALAQPQIIELENGMVLTLNRRISIDSAAKSFKLAQHCLLKSNDNQQASGFVEVASPMIFLIADEGSKTKIGRIQIPEKKSRSQDFYFQGLEIPCPLDLEDGDIDFLLLMGKGILQTFEKKNPLIIWKKIKNLEAK